MTLSEERRVVGSAYPGKNWAKKVLKMSDEEVHDIYESIMFRRENERKTAEKKKEQTCKNACKS